MDRIIRAFIIDAPEPVDPCADIIKKAASYYKEPLSDLKLKKPILDMFDEADTEQKLGDFVANIPKPGDVAACLPRKKLKGR